MRLLDRRPPRVVVKTHGLGSALAILGPLLAFFMAAAGMRGWEETSRRAMEKDADEMIRRGYRVVAADEYTLPVLGVAYFKVRYELAAAAAGR
jgi:hypothetical protein